MIYWGYSKSGHDRGRKVGNVMSLQGRKGRKVKESKGIKDATQVWHANGCTAEPSRFS